MTFKKDQYAVSIRQMEGLLRRRRIWGEARLAVEGIFGGEFVVFVVEKQTTKYLPTKQLPWMQRATPISVHVTTKNFNKPSKFSTSTKIIPPEKYPLYGICVP